VFLKALKSCDLILMPFMHVAFSPVGGNIYFVGIGKFHISYKVRGLKFEVIYSMYGILQRLIAARTVNVYAD
jgi:hypothetical protein